MVDLLDYDVKFGQGFLFSPPRPVRAEALQGVAERNDVVARESAASDQPAGKDGRPGVSLDWFNMLYQVLLGQEKGPRFGSFVAVYGVANAVAMIDGALARSA